VDLVHLFYCTVVVIKFIIFNSELISSFEFVWGSCIALVTRQAELRELFQSGGFFFCFSGLYFILSPLITMADQQQGFATLAIHAGQKPDPSSGPLLVQEH